jgi:hypothetical protein
MKTIFSLILLSLPLSLFGQSQLKYEEPVKQRVFVLTDITNEPDDQQSLVRFLVYANQYDIEGIVATTSTHLRKGIRQDKIEELISAYGEVLPNLQKHESGFPSAEVLLSRTASHLPLYSMEGVGEGKDSPGSELLIQAVDKEDPRPIWVSVWGGANCLAQALYKVQSTRSASEVEKFVQKIRVYAIADQDFSGQWIRDTFPQIFYIVDPTAGDNYVEYYKATWTGIGGDRFYKNGPMLHFDLVDNPWLMRNINEHHGPLGAYYLRLDYIMEGDTPSFLGLIQNGLAWYKSPSFGGWGGRYDFFQAFGQKSKIWSSSINSVDAVTLPDGRNEASNQATIWRWREAFQHDFAARMDWNIIDDYNKANHNPVISLNGNVGKALATANLPAGTSVKLSAKGTKDPDGDQLTYHWFVYSEAGKFDGKVELGDPHGEEVQFDIPKLRNGQALHLILEVKDNGKPSLTAYRRIVLSHDVPTN